MTYQLRHPIHGAVSTESVILRDRYLRRGFTLIRPVADLSYPELQAEARKQGIPANQSRAALLKALA